MKLGIIVPSINPEQFISWGLNKLDKMIDISEYSTFLVHGQKDWNERYRKEAEELCRSSGFDFKYIYTKGFEKPYPMIKIRQIAAQLDEGVDHYLSIDDDFEFRSGTEKSGGNSGRRHLECLHYLKTHNECGSIMTRSFFGGHTFGFKIIPKINYHYATACGIFLRNMKKAGFDYSLYPKSVWQIPGGCEETLSIYLRISDGYHSAVQFNSPTLHRCSKWLDVPDDDMHSQKCIMDNIGKYIREEFDDPDWAFTSKDKSCAAEKNWQEKTKLTEGELKKISEFDYKGISTEMLKLEIG